MGFTPLEGAIMGTRSGDVDPAIIPFIEKKEKISSQQVEDILNKQSGLLAITGRYTDRRDIIPAARAGDQRCQLAVNMESYRLRKYLGAYVAALGGLDAVAFTAGVGETQPLIRRKILEGLEFMGIKLDEAKNAAATDRKTEMAISTPDSPIKIFVIPTNEEIVFIEDVAAILEGRKHNQDGFFTYSFESTQYQVPGAKGGGKNP
jgi:acetate kinase